MPDHQLRLTAGGLTCLATLLSNVTAQAIWDALPLQGRANRWGDEIYFAIPVELDEDNAQAQVQVGDLAYWPPGNALCIFFGPTPASQADEPRAASPVNVFARIEGHVPPFSTLQHGAAVQLERA
ncbi:MAG: hypothetical protein JOZ87_08405 [Chloroflexi bacterium]|nr:hypothetical protein [Chloroflexota bacterium]